MRILIVDDDHELVDILTFALQRAGFDVVSSGDSASALSLLRETRPDLAVLDINIGNENGFDLLRQFRERAEIPVILLSARQTEEDKVMGLELGSDDYLTKPFGHRELIARIRAHLRRVGPDAPLPASGQRVFRVGPLEMDTNEHRVVLDGQPIVLTVTEFRMLRYLMSNAGKVVPIDALLKEIWGYGDPSSRSALRTTVHRLRRKLDVRPPGRGMIQTVTGVGIMLKATAPNP